GDLPVLDMHNADLRREGTSEDRTLLDQGKRAGKRLARNIDVYRIISSDSGDGGRGRRGCLPRTRALASRLLSLLKHLAIDESAADKTIATKYVTSDHHHICDLALFDRTKTIVNSENFGRAEGHRTNCSVIAQARVDRL